MFNVIPVDWSVFLTYAIDPEIEDWIHIQDTQKSAFVKNITSTVYT